MRDDSSLMAQPFDASRLELTGDASLIAENVFGVKGAAHNGFSVSSTGALAIVDASIVNGQLVWVDRQGGRLRALGPPARYLATPQLSPDGKHVTDASGSTKSARTFAFHESDFDKGQAQVSPDGRWLA